MEPAIVGILGGIAMTYGVYSFTVGPLDSLHNLDRTRLHRHPGQIDQHEQRLRDERFDSTSNIFFIISKDLVGGSICWNYERIFWRREVSGKKFG
jgi:hypothetical protein